MITQNKDLKKSKPEESKKNILDSNEIDYNDTPEIIQTILMPLELWCLKTIFSFKRPISAGEFFDLKIIQIFIDNLEHSVDMENPFKDNPKIQKQLISNKELKKILPNINNQHIYYETQNQDKFFIAYDLDRLKEMYNLSYEDVRIIEKELRNRNIDTPSYKLIVSSLDGLVSWGFLVKRSVEKKREKNQYIINPRLYIKYGQSITYFLRYGENWKIEKAKYDKKVKQA